MYIIGLIILTAGCHSGKMLAPRAGTKSKACLYIWFWAQAPGLVNIGLWGSK